MTVGEFWERYWRVLVIGAALVGVFVWGLAAGRALTPIPPTPTAVPTFTPIPTPTATATPVPSPTLARVPDVTLGWSGPIVNSETGAPVVGNVYVDGKLVQQGVAEVDLVILLHADRRTELRVEAPGYEPWALLVRGGGGNQRMVGPVPLIPVVATATAGPEV